jgi:DNA polymerase-1
MIVAVDTEWAREKPWCLSFSVTPGESWVVMEKQEYELLLVDSLLNRPDVITLIHNCLYDIPVLAKMGVKPRKVADTMIMAYLLQSEPQGLKPLAYRHVGMEMSSYTEMVMPAMYRRAMEYLDVVQAIDWGKPEPVLEWKDGKPHVKQPQGINRKVAAMLKKDPPDPWKKWKAMDGKEQVESAIGPMPKGELCDIPEDEAVRYAARDADATLRIYPILWERIQSLGLENAFWRDMGVIPMIIDMMENGMPCDRAEFVKLSTLFERKMGELQEKIQDVAQKYTNKYVNPGSSIQMAELIYDNLRTQDKGGRHKSKKAKTNRSTEDSVLKRYVDYHPVIQDLIDWRKYQKLKGTYCDGVPKYIQDGKIKCQIKITRAATGRMPTANPNMQSIPTRNEDGKRIRDCFVAPDGYVFLCGDYSGVEMRVAAHVAQDEKMIQIFRDGLDLHSQTASWMFNLPIDQIDELEHRYPAKRIGFGVLYMLTAKGLLREMKVAGLNWTLEQCEDAIRRWFNTFSGVAAFMKRNGQSAKRYGYVRDLYGRMRYVPGIRSNNKWVRLEAERQAGNAPIQMGAASIYKEAMGRLVPVYREYGEALKPCLPIHDDIVWLVRTNVLNEVKPRISEVMENAAPDDFSVPLVVDFKSGKKWGSVK